MLVDRGEEILFNIDIDSTGARFGGLSFDVNSLVSFKYDIVRTHSFLERVFN